MLNNSVDLTIVVASYQYGHLAAHCIESLLSQTKLPDSVLFLDDGVGDCTHLPKIYPECDYLLREENLGTVANFQDALMRVDTEYTMFLGADNWLRSDAVELLMAETPYADIVTYEVMVTGEHKMNHSAANLENAMNNGDVWWRREGHHGSIVYRTSYGQAAGYAQREGGINTEEDWVLWDRMMEMGVRCVHVNEPLLYYRRHRENFINCQ
jgi:GT2 family glycosyltransferase|tara:strand:+ start:523 stop:1155 length:633 start_codon:yes stop_codon:yes gene_type:complete